MNPFIAAIFVALLTVTIVVARCIPLLICQWIKEKDEDYLMGAVLASGTTLSLGFTCYGIWTHI